MKRSLMNEVPLEQRLADPASRNAAIEEVRQLASVKSELEARVLAQLSSVIREPPSIADVGKFASLLVDLGSKDFIRPLVEMIAADPECGSEYTLSYMYALGRILDEAEYAYEHPAEVFPSSFITQLGHWLLNTGGGELSWKAGIILDNIRVPQAFELMRLGAADSSLFFGTRLHCIHGLVNGLGVSELPFLRSLASDSDSRVHKALADAISWLERV
jgi:hypothetical protein